MARPTYPAVKFHNIDLLALSSFASGSRCGLLLRDGQTIRPIPLSSFSPGFTLDDDVSYAGIAKACGLQGVVARSMGALTGALNTAIKDQMENRKTTLIEVMLNQELGEPFRRDAMKKPVEVAGIDPADMVARAV